MRDRLIELLYCAGREYDEYVDDCHEVGLSPMEDFDEMVADHLLANGVVILDPKKYPPVTNQKIIETIMGVPLDEVAELIEAKQEGRVIVPPCKVGQTIFFYTCVCDKEGEEKFDILEGEVVSFSLQKEGLLAYCRYKCGLTYWHLVEEDFGKTVFLTKDEAEKALAERSKENAK